MFTSRAMQKNLQNAAVLGLKYDKKPVEPLDSCARIGSRKAAGLPKTPGFPEEIAERELARDLYFITRMKKQLLTFAMALLVYDFEFLILMKDKSYTSCHATATASNGVEAREKALRDCSEEVRAGKRVSATILKSSRPAGPGPADDDT